MKLMLKAPAPGTKRLKRNRGKLLSSFAFNFKLHHYSLAWPDPLRAPPQGSMDYLDGGAQRTASEEIAEG
jgi:hypothetical protein